MSVQQDDAEDRAPDSEQPDERRLVALSPRESAYLEELFETHGKRLIRILNRRGWSDHEAEDVLGGFTTCVLLERGLLGRLRAIAADSSGSPDVERLLNSSLVAYSIDVYRSRHAGDSFLVSAQSLNSLPSQALNENPAPSADLACDILKEALRRSEAHFRNRDTERHWLAFELRVLGPCIRNSSPPLLKQVAVDLGYRNADHVSAGILFVKRRIEIETAQVMIERGMTSPSDEPDLVQLTTILQRFKLKSI